MDDAQHLLDTTTGTDVLAALVALRELRDRLDAYEPELIAAARAAGMSWADLAPALGVASRQAAERRYLRLRPGNRSLTGDERVLAERDRRAADRAVTAWARANGADLRQLAGQISALSDLGPDAQPSLDRLHAALGDADATALPDLLAGTREHLPAALAERVRAIGEQIDAVRSNTQSARTHHRTSAEFADGSSSEPSRLKLSRDSLG
ncbi:type III effector protein [Virgisporangium ochraceum]|uniref:HSP18 transcriptional regulator n=1 Tax=Virgisporangium ochraceum TaxID=65505 RepID=A0A8J4A1B5_9ACTN|nr:type III effector protein [Virgisporangium ochraceum]GIJ72278.1 hypothetical protein Voc01_071950 [Virgisporangium ochraceum]